MKVGPAKRYVSGLNLLSTQGRTNMGSNIVFILGALLVVGLIVAATMRAAKAKKSPPPSDVVAEPAIQTPPITPGTGEWAIKPGSDTPATLPELPVSTAVEVWNQTGF